MIIEGQVNRPSNISFSDGADVPALMGKTAEIMTANQHEDIYALTYRGLVFHGYSTTSATIPVSTTTAPTFILWNPRSSGINVVLLEYSMGYESGTNKEGNIQLGILTNLGPNIRTGGPISAFTAGPTINGTIGYGTVNAAFFGIAATLAAAATKFYPLGISPMQLQANNSAPVIMNYKFYGSIILAPGTAVFSCTSNSGGSGAKYHERISWYEFPA